MSQSTEIISYKFLSRVYMLYYIVFISSMIMGYKLVSLGPLMQAPGSAIILTIMFFFGSVITEIYGYKIMRKLIWVTLLYAVIFSIVIVIISILPAPKFWHTKIAYGHIALHVFHFTVATTLGFIVSNFVNAYFISKSKIMFKGTYFWLRCYVIAAIAELTANIISLLITLFGNWNFLATLGMFMQAYAYKLAYGVVCCAIASIVIVWLRKAERLNVSDKNVNYNPFIVED